MIRRDWEQLPSAVRSAVERQCGSVIAAEALASGSNSHFAAILYTADRKFFCKGIAADHPNARMYHNEAEVNRYLPHSIAPPFVSLIHEDSWIILVFQHVAGEHANFSPESPDLVRIAEKISTMGLELAGVPRTVANPLGTNMEKFHIWRRLFEGSISSSGLDAWAVHNLAVLVAWEERAPLSVAGNALLHSDLNAGNILIGENVYFIDWAWASRGAPWVDIGFMIPRLIASGHSPERAEQWAQKVPTWSMATDAALTAFAVNMAGIAEYRNQQGVLNANFLAASSREWARYRLEST